jgi:hypothetical protein
MSHQEFTHHRVAAFGSAGFDGGNFREYQPTKLELHRPWERLADLSMATPGIGTGGCARQNTTTPDQSHPFNEEPKHG